MAVLGSYKMVCAGPLGDPASGVLVANDLQEGSYVHHLDGVLLEVVLELLGRHVHAID
jgi:hypothetical protein